MTCLARIGAGVFCTFPAFTNREDPMHSRWTALLILPASDGFPRFFIRRSPPLRLPLIPQLLAFSQRQLNLYFAVLEVHPHRNQRQSLLLRLADQLLDFFF